MEREQVEKEFGPNVDIRGEANVWLDFFSGIEKFVNSRYDALSYPWPNFGKCVQGGCVVESTLSILDHSFEDSFVGKITFRFSFAYFIFIIHKHTIHKF